MANRAQRPDDRDGHSRFLGRAEYDGYPGPIGPMTEQQYLAFEESVPGRFEYVNGYAYSMTATLMSGGTRAHATIGVNMTTRLVSLARATGCDVFNSDFRLRTSTGAYFYPDAMVSCGPTISDDARDCVDPCLVVEVLSPSTEKTDLGMKLDRYRAIPTLQLYLIAESTWRAVHRHWRDETGVWHTDTVAGDQGTIELPCPRRGVLTLDEIYERTNRPPEPPAPTLRRVREEFAADAAYSAG